MISKESICIVSTVAANGLALGKYQVICRYNDDQVQIPRDVNINWSDNVLCQTMKYTTHNKLFIKNISIYKHINTSSIQSQYMFAFMSTLVDVITNGYGKAWLKMCWLPLGRQQITTFLNQYINTLRPRQNGHHFADDIFKCIVLRENFNFTEICSLGSN